MKVGIIDKYLKKRWGPDRYKKLKAYGFDCVDYGMSNTKIEPYTLNEYEFDKFMLAEKALADEAGISIWQVHGPWRFPPVERTHEDRAERLEKMKKSIHGAALLGARYWIVHPIMPYGVEDIDTEYESETHRLNLEFMRELLTVAKAEGVTICLENMPFLDFSLSASDDIVNFIKEIDDPAFMMCLDTGHEFKYPNASPASVVRKHGKYIKALHVHDNCGARDEHLMPFTGEIDWEDFGKALGEVGFDGVMSLEHNSDERLPEEIFDSLYPIYAKIGKLIAGYAD